ncbi:hypothetical protein D3C87_1590750 [compost metagenome]
MIKPPNPRAYNNARLIKPACCILLLPSLKAMAPVCFISYNSAISWPSRFLLTAPIGKISTKLPFAILTIKATSALLWIAGCVLGITATAVYPPAAAAADPEVISSLVSKPGSPKLAFRSKKPIERIFPEPSNISIFLSATSMEFAILEIFPFSMNTSTTC